MYGPVSSTLRSGGARKMNRYSGRSMNAPRRCWRSWPTARVPTLCYTLVVPPEAGEANPEYAATLRELARPLRLPDEYVERIG